jgi:Fur family transcriptional regulator, peroxide stress response regulator
MDLSRAAIDGRLAVFRRRCGELGLALTPQRLAIYQMLAADDSHPSAEEIYRRIKPDIPSLSLGTVYRTLELFEEQGLVARVHAFGDQARFDANLEPHYHLVCIRCRSVSDREDSRLQAEPVGEQVLDGFLVLSRQVHLLGICPQCQTNT